MENTPARQSPPPSDAGASLSDDERWRIVIESTGQGVWDWNAQTNKVYFSSTWKAMLGYQDDEIGDTLDEWDSRLHPDDRQAVYADIERHFSGQTPFYENTHRVRAKDGNYRWILDRGSVFSRDEQGRPLRVVGTHTDVTRQRQERERLDRLAELVPGVLYQYVLYPDGRSAFPYASPGLFDIYGVSPDKVRDDAAAVFAVIHPDDLERVAAAIDESARTLSLWQAEYRVSLPGRGERWVSGQATPQRQEDGSILWHGYIHDVTERKNQEFELGLAHETAQAASQAKSDFLAQISHEIRTPMASIIGLSQLGMTETDASRLRDLLIKILSSGRLVLGMLNDVLDFSKIEAGKMQINPHPFLLQRLLDGLVNLFGLSAQAKGLELELDVDPRVAQAYVADELRLHQVLANLASNAVKFTEQGKVTVRVRWLACSHDVDTLEFSVSDTGHGISDEQKRHLFQAFSQGGPSVAREHGGSGLGLSISQRLVAAMGGSPVKVYSQLGQGATFHFELPMARCPAAQAQRLLEQYARANARAQTLRGHVLLVEDNPINQEVTLEQLRRLGLTISVAGDGQQAVDMVCTHPGAYDLILMDIQMPVLDGYSATRRIRELDAGLPIVALTASAMIEDREKALTVGMSGHVAKPVELEHLRRVLAQWLSADQAPEAWRPSSIDCCVLADPVATGFDPVRGASLIGGDTAFYRRLLQQFLDQLRHSFEALPGQLASLAAAGQARQHDLCDRAQRQLHSLKGVAANLSLDGLALVAGQLCRQLRQSEPLTDVCVQQFNRQFYQTKEQIMMYLGAQVVAPVEGVLVERHTERAAERSECLGKLHQLQAAVNASQYVDEALLRAIAKSLPAGLHGRYWPELQAAMDEFDMERAGQVVRAMCAELEQVL